MYAKEAESGKGRSPKARTARHEDEVTFALMAGVQANFSEWIVDSGTSRHMSGERGFFKDLEESVVKSVRLVDGRFRPVMLP